MGNKRRGIIRVTPEQLMKWLGCDGGRLLGVSYDLPLDAILVSIEHIEMPFVVEGLAVVDQEMESP
jgi:hypothetical protein